MDKICVCCGKLVKSYAKGLCRNCYVRFIRTSCNTVENFIELEKLNGEIDEKKLKIKALSSVLKFKYSDLGKKCEVSREAVRQWFMPGHKVPRKYVETVYEFFSDLALDATNVLEDYYK